MALIWAEGFTGDKALAPAWRALVAATARYEQADPEKAGEFAAAFKDQKAAQNKYDALVAEATEALRKLAQIGQSRTHVMIVGVGKYDKYDAGSIPAVTTSVHGARAFAEWALTKFSKADRPLGALELLSSPAPGQGEWTPSKEATAVLGLPAAVDLPGEAATFGNIKSAFERWLARAATSPDNAAVWYFAGHGLFKSEAILLPQDAKLPTEEQSPDNLIAPSTTLFNMQNHEPSIQCFFIDACSEQSLDLIYNQEEDIGVPLHKPSNGAAIEQRDATIYFGSYAGGKAYGPEDAAPYFTQELIACLDKRAGDSFQNGKQVTMSSLSTALKAAALHRAELENNPGIKFMDSKPGVIFYPGSALLCELRGPAEVLVQIRCVPKEAMTTAKLYIAKSGDGGVRVCRAAPRRTSWWTPVERGDWLVGADFDPPSDYNGKPTPFQPIPPIFDVTFNAR